jgi:hypothetical protein
MLIALRTTTTILGHCGQIYLNIRLKLFILQVSQYSAMAVGLLYQMPSATGYSPSTVSELLQPVKSKA